LARISQIIIEPHPSRLVGSDFFKNMKKTLVVLVDDDEDDLDILKEAIAAVDATLSCLCFINAADVIRAFSSDDVKPDFVFTDINMPGMTGDRLLQELRNHRQFDNTVITVLSTTIPHHVHNRLKDLGADHTFEKPIHFNDYAPILRRILTREI